MEHMGAPVRSCVLLTADEITALLDSLDTLDHLPYDAKEGEAVTPVTANVEFVESAREKLRKAVG